MFAEKFSFPQAQKWLFFFQENLYYVWCPSWISFLLKSPLFVASPSSLSKVSSECFYISAATWEMESFHRGMLYFFTDIFLTDSFFNAFGDHLEQQLHNQEQCPLGFFFQVENSGNLISECICTKFRYQLCDCIVFSVLCFEINSMIQHDI